MGIARWIVMSSLLISGTALAGIQNNGVQINGVQINGVQINGVQINGVQINGVQINGIQNNGVQINGVQINGVQINGTQIDGSFIGQGSASTPFSCSHAEDVTGSPLNNCSPCSQIVADADTYCRTNWWDSLCVDQARTMCRATVHVGSILPQTNASAPAITVTARTQVGWFHNGSAWVNHSDVWYNTLNWKIAHAPNVTGAPMPASTPSSCVRAVVAADPYCGSTYWDSLCVSGANSLCTDAVKAPQRTNAWGDSVCGYDANNNAIQGLFMQGSWDTRQGVMGGGAKIPSTTTFSIACRRVGAVAKCVDMGYRPWRSAADDSLHQTCVRAVRDDICGDGTSWTSNGHTINLFDYRGTQTDAVNWSLDAVWTPAGANYISYWGGGRSSGNTTWTSDLASYKETHPYCATQVWHPYSSPSGALTLDGSPNQIRTEREYVCTGEICNPG